MTGIITLQSAGFNTGPFSLYSNINNFTIPFETNLSKFILAQGFQSNNIPTNTNIVRIKSTGICESFIDVSLFIGSIVVSATSVRKPGEPGNTPGFLYRPRINITSSPILGISLLDNLVIKGTMFDNLNTIVDPSLLSSPVNFEITLLAGEVLKFVNTFITTQHTQGISCQITNISKTSSTGSDNNFYIIT